MRSLQRIWDEIRRGENIELYLTVVMAIGLIALNIVGIAPPTLIAPITLAVLGLIAISNLGTRHYFEEQLQKLTTSSTSVLRGRSELPSFHERGHAATEIVVVGISLISAIVPHLDFFEQKIKDGCTLRFLIIDPKSPALQIWNVISKVPNVQGDIIQTLNSLEVLIQMEQASKGKCEVRLSNVFLPFGIAAFDPGKDTGLMNVEMFAYKRTLGERHHFLLKRTGDSEWFEFFRSQYEQLWADSVTWKPREEDIGEKYC